MSFKLKTIQFKPKSISVSATKTKWSYIVFWEWLIAAVSLCVDVKGIVAKFCLRKKISGFCLFASPPPPPPPSLVIAYMKKKKKKNRFLNKSINVIWFEFPKLFRPNVAKELSDVVIFASKLYKTSKFPAFLYAFSQIKRFKQK